MKKLVSLRLLTFTAAILFAAPALFASCHSSSKESGSLQASSANDSDKSENGKPAKTSDANKPIKLNAAQFREQVYDYKANPKQFVYKGDKPAIIDFYADWCGPCRKLAPKLEKAAQGHEGKVVVYKVDVDVERELASIFDVQSIPMVLFVPVKGMPIQTMGNLPEEEIEKNIKAIVK